MWPWLWFDTFTHIKQWLDFHMSHVHYNFEYLGNNWNAPRFPWHVALVTTLFTVAGTVVDEQGESLEGVAVRLVSGSSADG